MKAIDAGHQYVLDSYDGGESEELMFMKREGAGYPFNVGHHGGTNCQEVLRVLIDRVKYLDTQIPCEENRVILFRLRSALEMFEARAAKRHGIEIDFPINKRIEELAICETCGHIQCEGHL